MTASDEDATRIVLSAIESDRQDLIDLCLDLGNRPPTQDAIGAGLAGATRPIAVDDLLATAKVIALTVLAICGVADKPVQH